MFQTLYSAARPRRFVDRAATGRGVQGHNGDGDDDDGGDEGLGKEAATAATAGGLGGWAGPASSPRGQHVGLRLHLPETVLFARGAPTKWLGTSDSGDGGLVVSRRSLANTYTARAKTVRRQTGGAKPGKTFEASVQTWLTLKKISSRDYERPSQ
jgi:hypothetical protein